MKKIFTLFAVLFFTLPLFSHSASAQTVGPRAYVSNDASNTVSVIDTGTNTVITTIPVGVEPITLTISPDGSRVYVANYTSCCSVGQGTVSVIDTSSYTVLATVPVGDNPFTPAVSRDGRYVYVPNSGDDNVSVIDTTTNTVTATITTATNPVYVIANPVLNRVYVSNQGNATISVIDTLTNTVLNTFSINDSAGGLAISSDGMTLYAADNTNNRVQVIDTATSTITGYIPMSQQTSGVLLLSVNTAGTRLYVTNHTSETLTVVDLTTNSVIAVLSFPDIQGRNINGVAVTPDDAHIYVTKSQTGETLAVVDAATNTVTGTIDDGGSGPSEIVIERPTSQRQLTSLAPAKVWVGLKNSDDVGVKFDLLAQVYKGSTLVTSGELDTVAAGSSGFNNAKLDTISFDTFSPVDFPAGSQLSLKLSVRNACTGSGHNSGTARLWYNDAQANSQFGATIDTTANDYYLLNNFLLGTSVGVGPKNTVDVAAGAKCSAYKPFGIWTITP